MKQKLLWSIGAIMLITNLQGQSISPYLFGQNAWMPHAYGSQVYYGQLDKLWPKVKASKVQMIRIGGSPPDFNRPTNAQYIALIDSIRKIGAEPLVQVPYGRAAYTSADAADIVAYINGTMGRNVKYWSVSNEPNIATQGYSTVPIATVESYFKSFASAMKRVDSSILIVGPDCAWTDATYYNSLIGGANDITGKDTNGRYYLDIVSFHTYPFDGTQTRADVINYPSGGLTSIINTLLTNINNANTQNGRSGSEALQWAITEFNVNYKNPTSNTLAGVGVESFLNGQFWAECFGIGMANNVFAMLPWSIHESEGSRSTYDLGYLDNNTTFVPRPSYYHERMMAGNFKGTVISSSDNQSLIKTFAAKDTNQISVMILNQNQTNGYPFTLQLDKTTVTGTSLAINVDAGIHRSIKDSIPPQSSWILVYDTTGTLKKKCIYSFDRATAIQAPACSTPGSSLGITNPVNDGAGKLLTVAPNPATDKFELLFNSTGSYDTFIIITDEQGNEFYSNYYSSSSQQKETVHVSDWESGIYFIYVNTGDTKITKKLIVE